MVHDIDICKECHYYKNIENYSCRERHCRKCDNYGEKMLPATVRMIHQLSIAQIDCPHCYEEIISDYDNFVKYMGCEFASELVGRIIKCPSCEKEIEIEDWEWI